MLHSFNNLCHALLVMWIAYNHRDNIRRTIMTSFAGISDRFVGKGPTGNPVPFTHTVGPA